jgi:transmembrane sensor
VSTPVAARDVADEAAEWAVRIDAGEIDPDTDPALRRWLDGDRRREGALLRAEAALSFVDRGRALVRVVPMPERGFFWLRRRRLLAAAAVIAASVAGVSVLLVTPHRYDTHLGEVRSVPLADGSVVAINTQSAVEVTMKASVRQVTLARGEAWFSVAHDPARPFIVAAGRVRVRAVGTAFSVHRHDDGADVLVTQGTVETWVSGEEDRRVRVAAGFKAFVAEYTPPRLVEARAEIDRALAWRDGRIVLEGETLGEAVERFNRYNARKLAVSNSALANEKLVGEFRATEPYAFASAIATTLGASVVEHGDTIVLSRRE